MEILPHLWISYYGENLYFIKEKKIKNIIHLSKKDNYIKKLDIEEIKINIDYNENTSYEDMNNIMYQHLFDITDYIHEKILNNQKILILGDYSKQDIDTILIAYYIRYGQLTIQDSIIYLKSKKENIFSPKCLFYSSLNKFYNELNKKF
jgi:protein-tyrosine phosphatase